MNIIHNFSLRPHIIYDAGFPFSLNRVLTSETYQHFYYFMKFTFRYGKPCQRQLSHNLYVCLFYVLCTHGFAYTNAIHCIPGEAYMRLIAASCKAGPGATPMCIFEICLWRILILEFADRCYFWNSTYGLPLWHFYIEIVKFLKLSCQGSNLCPTRISQDILDLKVSPAWIEPATFRLVSWSLHQYTIDLSCK
jgi:hypothetical protein